MLNDREFIFLFYISAKDKKGTYDLGRKFLFGSYRPASGNTFMLHFKNRSR